MYSQFSDVRFSSVALAVHNSQWHSSGGCIRRVEASTDDLVKSVLLSSEHYLGKLGCSSSKDTGGNERKAVGCKLEADVEVHAMTTNTAAVNFLHKMPDHTVINGIVTY